MNVPKLRFGEFFDNWSHVKLGDIYPQIRNGFVGIATPFYAETGIQYLQGKNVKNGAIDPTGLIYVSEDFNNKYRKSQLKLNDIVMVQSGHVGECAVISENYVGANCHALIVLTPKKSELTSSSFFVYYFYSKYGKKLIHQIKTGNTIEHVLASEVKNLSPLAPTFKEQAKIANFLTVVDEKISQLTQKSDLLAQYKKGLMQKIFNQELRFKDDDGREFPEWEERAVGEIFRVTRGNVLAMPLVSEVPTDSHIYPVYSSQTKNNGLSGYYYEYLFENCITWTTDGANAGDVNFRSGKFYCTNVCGVLVNNDGYTNACIAAMINAVSRKYVSYVGNPKLMNGVMAKITIEFPSVKEQTKIANFLTAIDDKITQTQAELDAVKQYKQGILQQMFV